MPEEWNEITKYQYYIFSSRSTGPYLSILFYGNKGYLGAASFSTDPAEQLKPATKYESGIIGLYYRMNDFPIIIDMLRNEKPVILSYNGPQNSRILVGSEPVGEGELPGSV